MWYFSLLAHNPWPHVAAARPPLSGLRQAGAILQPSLNSVFGALPSRHQETLQAHRGYLLPQPWGQPCLQGPGDFMGSSHWNHSWGAPCHQGVMAAGRSQPAELGNTCMWLTLTHTHLFLSLSEYR